MLNLFAPLLILVIRWGFSTLEEMLLCSGRPKYVSIESRLTEVDEVVVESVDCCFALITHSCDAIDKAI